MINILQFSELCNNFYLNLLELILNVIDCYTSPVTLEKYSIVLQKFNNLYFCYNFNWIILSFKYIREQLLHLSCIIVLRT